MTPDPRARILLVAALFALASGCSDRGLDAIAPCEDLRWAGPAPRTPVVLIVNDTMRRDRLGAYGGPARTPAFDRFAKENLLFSRSYTQAPWTRPSMATLFTSLYPSQHGLQVLGQEGDQHSALGPEFTTLAEVLRATGYRTAAFVANPWMDRGFGFAQGFDSYEDSFAKWDADGSVVVEAALSWLRGVPEDQPFLLFLHTIDSHRPYPALRLEELESHAERIASDRRDLPRNVRAELQQLVRIEGADPLAATLIQPSLTLLELSYEKGIEQFDRALATFLAGFEQTWAARRAVVIVTSDHGEALYTRGYGNHGQGLFDDEIAVPLAVRLPGVESSGPTQCPVGLIDVLPTLCSYLGIACPDGVAGRSWLATAGDDRRPAWLIAEGVGGQPRHRSVRNERYKLIWEPDVPPDGVRANPYRLYDIQADPTETHDLLEPRTAEAERVFESLSQVLETDLPVVARPEAARAKVDEETQQRLRELGYTE